MKITRQKWLLCLFAVALAGLLCSPAAWTAGKDHRVDDFGDHLEHLYEHVLPDPPPKPPPAVVTPPPAPVVVVPPPPAPPAPGPLVIDNVTGYASDPVTGRIVVIKSSGAISEYNFGSRGVTINWATGIEGPPDFIKGPHKPPGTSGVGPGHGPHKPPGGSGGGQTKPPGTTCPGNDCGPSAGGVKSKSATGSASHAPAMKDAGLSGKGRRGDHATGSWSRGSGGARGGAREAGSGATSAGGIVSPRSGKHGGAVVAGTQSRTHETMRPSGTQAGTMGRPGSPRDQSGRQQRFIDTSRRGSSGGRGTLSGSNAARSPRDQMQGPRTRSPGTLSGSSAGNRSPRSTSTQSSRMAARSGSARDRGAHGLQGRTNPPQFQGSNRSQWNSQRAGSQMRGGYASQQKAQRGMERNRPQQHTAPQRGQQRQGSSSPHSQRMR
ncbi:MAG: hypothetical protein AB9866_15865 [Syntrophobacteraceae bacterium]